MNVPHPSSPKFDFKVYAIFIKNFHAEFGGGAPKGRRGQKMETP